MPSYKVTYFNIKGLAEPIRFMFHYAGVDFVDQRMNEEDWKKLKPSKFYKVTHFLCLKYLIEVSWSDLKIWTKVAVCRQAANKSRQRGQ